MGLGHQCNHLKYAFLSGKNMNNKLKDFDIVKAKAGEHVITRDGRDVRIICFDAKGDFPIVALVPEDVDNEEPELFSIQGKWHLDWDTDKDLFMKPVKKTYWVNVYKGAQENLYTGNTIYESLQTALTLKHCANYVGTSSFEIEE